LLVAENDSTGTDGSSRVWKTVDGTTPTSGNGYELLYERVASSLGAYTAYYPTKTTGTKSVGLSAPSTTFRIVSLELVGDEAVYLQNNNSSAFATASSRTFNITVPDDNQNYCLIAYASVGVQPADGTDSGVTTTMSYGGVSLTSANKTHSNGGSQGYIELFYLVDPPAGANTLTLTASTTADLKLVWFLFGNVNQANPISGLVNPTGSSTTSSVTLTNVTPRHAFLTATVSTNNLSAASSTTGLDVSRFVYNNNNLSDAGCTAYQVRSYASTASPTLSWTVVNGPWAAIGILIQPTSYFSPGTLHGLKF
jgi:hypothetical protein